MTITTTITCDACGKTETWPGRGALGQKDEWQELLHEGRWRHVCSTACELAWLDTIRDQERAYREYRAAAEAGCRAEDPRD